MADRRARRIFVLGNLADTSLPTILRAPHYWLKGLIRCGCDVQTFSYRNMLMRSGSPLGKVLAPLSGKRRVVETLLAQLVSYQPDVVFLPRDRVKDLDEATAGAMREAVRDAVFVTIAHDWLPELDAIRVGICRHMDIVLTTSAGAFLNTYKDLGVDRCAYMPNPCDPDVQHPYEVGPKWKTDIMFAGRLANPKVPPNPERHAILTRLARMPNVRLYGCFDRPTVRGIDCFRAISGARVALSINMINGVRLCHSNRFINSIACGTFTLAKRVPDSDLLFEDKIHVRYFDTVEEFFDLAKWYLQHDDERERIARTGMEHAHREYNCRKMAGHLLDLIQTGRIDAPWAEIA
jgi:spore maturation protein CgeB